MTSLAEAPPTVSRALLWAEFAALYVGAPLALAFVLSPGMMWALLAGATLIGMWLLWRTPGFSWRELIRGPLAPGWRAPAAFAALTAAVALALTAWLLPGRLFALPRHAPGLWLLILVLYPILSAAPQEAIYRVLFFRRYGALFPGPRSAMLANAAVFSLAHLFLWNWVAPALTFFGGLIFAWAWRSAGPRGGFLFATFLHAIAGWIIFTSGLGTFFFHGGVPGG